MKMFSVEDLFLYITCKAAIGPVQLVIHGVQNCHAGTGGRQTKEITILNDVSSLFVFSQCVLCFPAWRFCTKKITSCKEPIPL